MDSILWIVQTILAIIFLVHGWVFLKPPEKLKETIVNGPLPTCLRKFIGVMEMLAAAGLLLPGILNLFEWLTPLAACGLGFIMAGATVFHVSRREWKESIVTTVLLFLAFIILYLRWPDQFL